MFRPFDKFQRITQEKMDNIINDQWLETILETEEWEESEHRLPENKGIIVSGVEVNKSFLWNEKYLLKYLKSWVDQRTLSVYKLWDERHMFIHVTELIEEEGVNPDEESDVNHDKYIIYTKININNV